MPPRREVHVLAVTLALAAVAVFLDIAFMRSVVWAHEATVPTATAVLSDDATTPTATSTPDVPPNAYERLPFVEQPTIVTAHELEAALVGRGWPVDQATQLATAAQKCEAPAYDRIATAQGWVDLPTTIGIDLAQRIADGGTTWSVGIHLPAHPGIERRYDLATLAGTADALTEIRTEAIRQGERPLQPWDCVR